jgi:hypothetical protein
MTVDPGIQQIWTDMLTFMGTDYGTCYASITMSGNGQTQTINCTDQTGGNFEYREFVAGIKVTITPPTANLGPGETQQFTATATNPDGSQVANPVYTWAMISGSLGTVDATGLYTAPATIAANATSSLKCSLNGSQSYASVMVSLHP